MLGQQRLGTGEFRGILSRLRRDRRGNAIAIAAAALIPLLGFSGSAVDMARLYIVRVRLQQACDAGVLAGRKVMTDTQKSTPLEAAAKKTATDYFSNNFRDGYLKTTAVSFTPVKASSGSDTTVANAVTGNATATVPMAVMGFFGAKPVKMDVTCQAVFDLADTDVMFVLDTTGSMSCKASDSTNCAGAIVSDKRSDNSTRYYNKESSDSKIEALRKAVILFDTTMRANADLTTHFRYGFVTYSSSVNVGDAVRSIGVDNGVNYLQNTNWTYQTRYLSPAKPANVPYAIAGDYAYGPAFDISYTGVPQSICANGRSPATGFAKTGLTWSDQGYVQARSYYNLTWKADGKGTGTCAGKEQPLRAMWRYGPASINTALWTASLSTGNAVVNPSRLDGDTGTWRGCIEELNTTTGSSFDAGSLPDDLNPDVKPSSATNLWRPQWPDVIWSRNGAAEQDVPDDQVNEGLPNAAWTNRNYGPDAYYDKNGSAACGMPAKRLQSWTAQQVKDYVYNAEFKAYGGTYHDVGMIWGTRMLSPSGIFARDTAAWAGRKAPSRNIVFMTDGTMSPSQNSYGLYGVERFDNRTGGANDTDADFNNHTARFLVECEAARRKGFTIYVVALGTGVSDDLTACASPGQTFEASSTDELTAAFKTIAQRVAMLRISV